MRDIEIDPDAGIPDLIRRLTSDSKRLASDEVRLAKLEMAESVKTGARGALWVAVAFGAGVIAMVALTIALVTFIGRLASGHMWIGALVTAAIELPLAFWLVTRGVKELSRPSYTFAETRESVKDTVGWASR